jgi:hypothetical protein
MSASRKIGFATALYVLGVLTPLLASCKAPPTYADVQATAQITGCWPDYYPTPRAVTVTPAGTFALGASPTVLPGTPTRTALPTSTPYPRCPPQPGETAVAWPTPVPPPPPFPTMEPRPWQTGADLKTTLHLPNTVLTVDIATHPTENWPAVASVVWSGTDDPDRVLVSVFDPRSGTWSSARQVDIGPSAIGRYTRTVAIAITGDRIVHAVWGMSDPDFSDNDPPSGIWTSSSADFGETWSTPERIATGCRRVNDVAASSDGTLVVQLVCDDGPRASVAAIVVRQPNGAWSTAERLPVPAWYYSEGAVVITGEGREAKAVGVLFAGSGVPTTYFMSRRIADSGDWRVRQKQLATPSAIPLGIRMWHVRGLAYERSNAESGPSQVLTFTWTDAEFGSAYAITSLDGGASWGSVERIASPIAAGGQIAFVTPAYDPAADRLAAIWTCCGDDSWEAQGSTHYASWSTPGNSIWQAIYAPGQPGAPIPLVLGARSAAETVSAQAHGSRTTWLAWIERQQQVEVRSLDLNQLIPVEQYAPTPIGGSS